MVPLFANESMPDHVGFARVKINLINENDNRPIFSQVLYNISLFENVTVGTTILKVLVASWVQEFLPEQE
uniref:Cadherin-23 n=1 Tax=Sphaerodactylus townsendi TaxID=933632 RepID=A0ACB8F982_9SAUR